MERRPAYKFDLIKKARWLLQYEKARSVTAASKALNLHRSLIYDALDPKHNLYDAEFVEKKAAIDDLIIDVVESRLFSLTRTNPTACFYYLGNRRPDKWKSVQHFDHTTGGEKLNPQPLANLSDDELKRQIKVMNDKIKHFTGQK